MVYWVATKSSLLTHCFSCEITGADKKRQKGEVARPELILISVSLKQLGIFCCRGRDTRVSESFQAVSCLYPSIPLGGEERCGVNFVFVQENNAVTRLTIIDP